MKKTLALLTAAVMAISLAGCAGSGNKGGTDTSPQQTEAALQSEANSDYTFGQVSIGGGGFVTGIISTNEPGLFYARTDVGGAYRWDKDSKAWVSLSYDISKDDVGLLGIDGIAADPNNAANVYMCAGTSYFSGGKTCMMVSHDYGSTFEQVDVTDMIRVHGNGMGRGNGERIAVDPNNSDIIMCGGRSGGLIRSEDGGKTWNSIDFPVTSTSNENGINILLFDPAKTDGSKTTRIYAGVSRRGDVNIYISEDAGVSWQPYAPANDMQKYMPQRFDLDSKGRLYVCYGNNEGPWNSMTGGLYRYDTDSGEAYEMPVEKATIGDIVIDPSNDDNIILVTSERWEQQPNGAYGDVFFRSTDGGATWEELSDKYTMSTNGMDWIGIYAIHWCSVLAMDSADSGHIMVNSGNGIFACDNIWDEKPEFYFNARGIEEVVPLDLVSYKDYPLVSAIGDYDGFVHEDITVPATRHNKQIGTTTSLSIAAQNHDIWAKVGGSDSEMLLCYSTDGNKTWKSITNSPVEGKTLYQGKLALNADGTSLIWSPSNGMHVYQTDDWGETWNEVSGIAGASDVYLIGDCVDADTVYACSKGVFFVSSDKGKTFKRKYDSSSDWKRLAVSPDEEGRVYIPAGGMGLITTADKGENMALVPGLKYCEAVGLGKPAKEGDPYVIYVWGTPKEEGSPEGIWATEDNGENWYRVNDDAHEFGGTGNGAFVVGDMNEYGTVYMSTVGLGIVYARKNG